MIRLRRATVIEARAAHPGCIDLDVDLAGERARAIAYPGLCGPVRAGDVVLLNTTAMTLGLGTGGVHIVVAVEGRDADDGEGGHAMKLRYTPHQVAVDAVEETHPNAIDVPHVGAMPVVVAGLHSSLPAAAIGARTTVPAARIAYIMTDAAALHLGFSRTVPVLRAHGLIDVTITAGQATGGDHEAVNLYSAIVAARTVCDADLAIVAMGPGNLGTGSRWGFALLEVADIINACEAVGARPVVAPRISFTDPRERHRIVSHHTRTALAAARGRAQIALPPMDADRTMQVRGLLTPLTERHRLVPVDLSEAVEAALADSPVPLRTMGRSYADDPDVFRAAAAAGVRAAELLRRGPTSTR